MSIYQKLSTLFFLQFVIWGGWMVTLGSYLLHGLGFSGQQVGYVYASTAIAATISPFLIGILADRKFSTQYILAILHLLGGVVMIVATFCEEFRLFYPLFILYTLLYIPTFSLSNSLSFQHLTNIEREFPKVRVWGTVSWIGTGLIISLFVWEEKVYPLYLSAAFSFITAIFAFYLPKTPPKKTADKAHWLKGIGKDLLPYFSKKNLVVLLLSLVLIRISSSFYYSFVNPYLIDIDISYPTAKMTLGQLSEILIMLAMPFLMQKFKAKWILGIGLFFWGFRYYLFDIGADEGNGWMIYAAIFAHGVTFNFANLAAQIYIDRMVPERLRSTAQGLVILITMGIGIWIGSYFAGWVVDTYTVDGARIWSIIWDYPTWIGVGVTLLFILLFPNKPIKNVDHE